MQRLDGSNGLLNRRRTAVHYLRARAAGVQTSGPSTSSTAQREKEGKKD